MPTVSVKLPDSMKARIDEAADKLGITPHAFMVGAIERVTQEDELRRSFVQDALVARDNTLRSGKVYDGKDVATYLRAKLAGKPVAKPRPRRLASYSRRRAA
jgi:predicted transcriptional regulator